MGIVLLVLAIVLLVLAIVCCLLLPLLIGFGMSQSKEDRGRAEVPFLKRGNTHNGQ